MHELKLFAASLLLLLPQAPVQAQQDNAIYVNISPCLSITGREARLACYDGLQGPVLNRQADDATVAPQQAAPVAATEPSAETTAVQEATRTPGQTVAGFGYTVSANTAIVKPDENGKQELHDRIVSMQQREPNRWVITLASGQVWYQTNSSRSHLKVGEEVKIYPSPLGNSFRMATEEGSSGFIQVDRVK